jgi:squalene synthase HpnC
MPVDHYENFPVASVLLPAALREPVEAIYAFARSADDIADEGSASASERLAQLAQYQAQLNLIEQGATPTGAMFARLATAVRAHQLPIQLLRDLLDAFAQDVVKTRYANFAELLDYTRRSANPVGRLMLHLYRQTDALSLEQADSICSALQLINFWQDVGIDRNKGRIYLPQDALTQFGVSETQVLEGRLDPAWRALMQFETQRARALMFSGAPLASRLRGRIGFELRLVIQGGLRILEMIEQAGYDVFRQRPELTATSWLRVLWRAAMMGSR